MSPQIILAGIMLGALVLYSLLAGADFGAGFWDLTCVGPRKEAQRNLIVRAIEPVWEVNHIWLILIIVLMFSGFPTAFGPMWITVAIPLFLALLGIVLRGASYIFRAYFVGEKRPQLYWGRVFAITSSLTPLFLGIVIGTISSDTVSRTGFVQTWLAPFPLAVGVLALSLFSYLSACYLTVEADDAALQNDFRNRALFSGFVSVMAAFATFVIAGNGAQEIRNGLSHGAEWLIQIGAATASLIGFQALWTRHYRRARMAAIVQVTLIIFGWGVAQYPYLVRPEFTIYNSHAPVNVLVSLEAAVGVGAIVLIPSLALLLFIFKANRKSRSARADTTV